MLTLSLLAASPLSPPGYSNPILAKLASQLQNAITPRKGDKGILSSHSSTTLLHTDSHDPETLTDEQIRTRARTKIQTNREFSFS